MIYGQWRRVVSREELDAFELRQRDTEEAWDLRNEVLADHFDALVGKLVRLRAETPIAKTMYPRHSSWKALWRNRDWLIVAYLKDTTFLAVVEAAKFELLPALRNGAPLAPIQGTASEYLEQVMNRLAMNASER